MVHFQSMGTLCGHRSQAFCCSVRGPATREICYRQLHEKGAVRILNVTVEAAIATDIATMMAQRADEMEHAAFANDSNKVATIIKSYQKKLPRRQSRLVNDQGEHAPSYTEERHIVRAHLAQQLNGTVVAMADILRGKRAEAITIAG